MKNRKRLMTELMSNRMVNGETESDRIVIYFIIFVLKLLPIPVYYETNKSDSQL